MLKLLRNTAIAATASLACVVPAHAAIVFDAQFTETYFGLGDGDPTTDTVLDQFLFSLTQDGPGTFDITIDAIFVTMPDPIVVDIDPALPATSGIGVGIADAPAELAVDGESVFGLGFSMGDFGIGDGYAYNIDVDGVGPVVNGSFGSAGSIFSGGSVEVVYSEAGVAVDESLTFTFGMCEGDASPEDCSQATGRIPATDLGGGTPVPAPMSIALLGVGLLGLARVRRRRG